MWFGLSVRVVFASPTLPRRYVYFTLPSLPPHQLSPSVANLRLRYETRVLRTFTLGAVLGKYTVCRAIAGVRRLAIDPARRYSSVSMVGNIYSVLYAPWCPNAERGRTKHTGTLTRWKPVVGIIINENKTLVPSNYQFCRVTLALWVSTVISVRYYISSNYSTVIAKAINLPYSRRTARILLIFPGAARRLSYDSHGGTPQVLLE